MKTIGILHNEASVLSALPLWSAHTGETMPDLLTECAPQPLLAHILNLDTPQQYPGLRGCLVDPERWGEFALTHESAPASLILSPALGLNPAHAAMALRRLGNVPEAPAKVGVLVESSRFLEWVPVLSALDEVVAIWDTSLPLFGDAGDANAWAHLLLAMGPRWRGLFAHDASSATTAPPPFFRHLGSVSWLRSEKLN